MAHNILVIIAAKGMVPLAIAGFVSLWVWLLSRPNGSPSHFPGREEKK